MFDYESSSGTWSQSAKLTASDGAAGDEFGRSVSLDGNRALMGAYRDDDKGYNSGSAYLFVRNRDGNWSEASKLTADDGAPDDYFGYAVSMDADRALVGAFRAGNYAGAAYIQRYPCAFGGKVTAGIWSMIGIPCDTGTQSVADVFGDEIGGNYLYDWIVYKRDDTTGNYAYLDIDDPLEQNRGYWIKVLDSNVTWYAEGNATTLTQSTGCTSQRGCYEVDLHLPSDSSSTYQNLVGNPLSISFDWKDVRVLADDGAGTTVYTPAQAEDNNITSKTIHLYNGNSYDPCDGVTAGFEECHLFAQEGFWVETLGGASAMSSVKLLIPFGDVQ
nr:FG-GAP repeat protein [Sulfurovum sp.]